MWEYFIATAFTVTRESEQVVVKTSMTKISSWGGQNPDHQNALYRADYLTVASKLPLILLQSTSLNKQPASKSFKLMGTLVFPGLTPRDNQLKMNRE
ncbi:uncharacterized protein CLUP02_02118 [Colletotrichum lupini]|uniref:Uncharacterized protein n=1 Tax=Colletotrichum lupini TaxID=145971 RepID=A0A9Q8SDW6_9PEZI|nr:uncharacterized protein CLUP02_02118 [Colletotrichum lupini]UQC75464.1 hypothetical protein CLUP02_02118 [Colletotrichum lupini]